MRGAGPHERHDEDTRLRTCSHGGWTSSTKEQTRKSKNICLAARRAGRGCRELLRMGDAVCRALLEGHFGGAVSAAFVRRLQEDGLNIREYRPGPVDSVVCTVAPGRRFRRLLATGAARGVRQLDLVFAGVDGGSPHRSVHIPFDAAAGVVTVVPPMPVLEIAGACPDAHATAGRRECIRARAR